MKRIFCYILAIGAIITGAACSVVNEAIKSGDPQYAYEQALELYENGKWDQASTLFEACRHIYMGTPREDSLSFYNARCKFMDHDWEEAASQLDTYRRKFSRSPFIEEAEGMYALCHYYMSPPPEYDQTMTTQAIIAITEFMSRYPDSPYTEQMMYYTTISAYRLAENSVESKQLDRYLAMLDNYYSFIAEYPESKHVRELERLAKSARNFLDKKANTEM